MVCRFSYLNCYPTVEEIKERKKKKGKFFTLTKTALVHLITSVGLTGKTVPSLLCYVDSCASDHMTSSLALLVNVKPYEEKLQIHTANGERLHVKSVDDIPHSLP